MVRLDLHAEGKSEKSCTQDSFRQPPFYIIAGSGATCLSQSCPICIYDTGKYPREIRYGLHLGVVSHLYDLHVV